MNNSRRKLLTAAPLALAGMAQAKPAAGKTRGGKRVYYPDGKPAADKEIPLYSEVISHGGLIFVCGHGVNTSTDVRQQTKAVLDWIEQRLHSAGSSMAKALKCNVFLRHLEDYAAMNEVYRGRFGAEPPVRTTVAVAGIPLDGCLVEIEVIAGA
ncbi:MAG: RidA family protein [Bryobacteraceae bacterium]